MSIKGTTSPQAHARVDEKHFTIVGRTFSTILPESSERSFRLFESRSSSEIELNILFTNVLYTVMITEAVAIFVKAFAKAEEEKSSDELYAN